MTNHQDTCCKKCAPKIGISCRDVHCTCHTSVTELVQEAFHPNTDTVESVIADFYARFNLQVAEGGFRNKTNAISSQAIADWLREKLTATVAEAVKAERERTSNKIDEFRAHPLLHSDMRDALTAIKQTLTPLPDDSK